MTPCLQAENISKSYGSLTVFSGISLVINQGDKVALVARNGEGKTTLLNILSGKDTADSGTVTSKRGLSVGYLEQEPELNDGLTVLEQVFFSSGKVVRAIREYEAAVATGDQGQIERLTAQMDALQAWDQETRAKQILTELNITEFNKVTSHLSGGQRKRVALAKVLIDEPELLILDEPTNHLDLDMIEWLENYLGRSGMTLLMVTHDRYFLDRVCSRIIELESSNIYNYQGNYSYYVEKRAERLENIRAGTDKARNLLRRELEWMRSTPKARTGKSKSRKDAFYELKEKASGPQETGTIKIKAGTRRLGNKIVELRHTGKKFGNETVIDDFSYIFSRFEKVGIIGRNGTGKSTFLNIVTGSAKPDTGVVDKGQTVRFGYFRQEGIIFDDNQRVIDAVRDIAEVVRMSDGSSISAQQFLNHFLFPPQRQHDYIGKLSGGEKRRLYLVTVLMRNPNFLVLDEPTNDLDIETLNVLEDYLATAGICLLVVSHDRFFLDKISDHIFVFEGNGVISNFPGNYTQYRNHLKENPYGKAGEPAGGKSASGKPATTSPGRDKKKIGETEPRGKKRLGFKEKRELEQLEKEIEELEREKAEIEAALAGGNLQGDKLHEYSARYAVVDAELDARSDRWLELGESEE